MNQKRVYIVMILATVLFGVFIAGFIWGKTSTPYEPYSQPDSTFTVLSSEDDTHMDWKININTATVDQLTMLDGIGETLAQRIIDYRTEHGPFEQIADIMNVTGIGSKKFEQISKYITIGG